MNADPKKELMKPWPAHIAFPSVEQAITRYPPRARGWALTELDPRDMHRLALWLSDDQLAQYGCKRVEGAPVAWTPESVAEQIHNDLAFALEKARGRRGISASLCAEILQMWAKICGLEITDVYEPYGWPIIREFSQAFTGADIGAWESE